ncbi:MAG: alkaline phosphatase family protein [Vicinamibacterales bacterium]
MSRCRVVAIGLDAAEQRLVQRLIEAGEMPVLARLAAAGVSGRVSSPAPIGSGAVWPTFITGTEPDVHGLFGEHSWNAATMALEPPRFQHLEPFWRRLAAEGARVSVLDVPFAPVSDHPAIVDVADWGAHDWLGGRRMIRPAEIEARLHDLIESPHPLAAGQVDSTGPFDVDGLRNVIAACTKGARLRGDVAIRLLEISRPDVLIVGLTEIHRASHLLWHTIDPHHPAWRESGSALPADIMPGLVEVFRAADAAIGRILDRAGAGAALVFSLHGMQPARGVPSFLGDVLERWGFAVRRGWSDRSLREHIGGLASAMKRRIPTAFKNAYYRRIPKTVTMRLAQPSMPMPAWDWSRTVAFSLPTDQHGWIRLNLRGRESKGIVPPEAYEETARTIATRIRMLASPEGPLVDDVLITGTARMTPRSLPDLVVHWTSATWRPELRLVDPPITSTSVGHRLVSQHDHDGFFIAEGFGTSGWPSSIDAADLGVHLAELVRG